MGLLVEVVRVGQEIDLETSLALHLLYLKVGGRLVRATVEEEGLQAILSENVQQGPAAAAVTLAAGGYNTHVGDAVVFSGSVAAADVETYPASVMPPAARPIQADAQGNPIMVQYQGPHVADYLANLDDQEADQG